MPEPGKPYVANQTTYLQTAGPYPERFKVADADAAWEANPQYEPEYYVHPAVLEFAGDWADHEPETDEERLQLVAEHKNPHGRTGIEGRGLLGRWGLNRTVDPIVTRYNAAGELELLTINRGDTGALALPGWFVDPGEPLEEAAAREAKEETTIEIDEEDGQVMATDYYMYTGPVTDNAWIKTASVRWHLEGSNADQLPVGQDDAESAQWVVVNHDSMRALVSGHAKLVDHALSN